MSDFEIIMCVFIGCFWVFTIFATLDLTSIAGRLEDINKTLKENKEDKK